MIVARACQPRISPPAAGLRSSAAPRHTTSRTAPMFGDGPRPLSTHLMPGLEVADEGCLNQLHAMIDPTIIAWEIGSTPVLRAN